MRNRAGCRFQCTLWWGGPVNAVLDGFTQFVLLRQELLPVCLWNILQVAVRETDEQIGERDTGSLLVCSFRGDRIAQA